MSQIPRSGMTVAPATVVAAAREDRRRTMGALWRDSVHGAPFRNRPDDPAADRRATAVLMEPKLAI
jgi:hypothetical protein